MEKSLLIVILFFVFAFNTTAQTLSGLSVSPYPSSDTGSVSRTMIDVVAKFECSQSQNVDYVMMKIGNAPGQSQLKEVKATIELQNGNLYTVNGKNIYKITDNKLIVRSTSLKFVEVKGKFITVSVKYKNGTVSEDLSIQY